MEGRLDNFLGTLGGHGELVWNVEREQNWEPGSLNLSPGNKLTLKEILLARLLFPIINTSMSLSEMLSVVLCSGQDHNLSGTCNNAKC